MGVQYFFTLSNFTKDGVLIIAYIHLTNVTQCKHNCAKHKPKMTENGQKNVKIQPDTDPQRVNRLANCRKRILFYFSYFAADDANIRRFYAARYGSE